MHKARRRRRPGRYCVMRCRQMAVRKMVNGTRLRKRKLERASFGPLASQAAGSAPPHPSMIPVAPVLKSNRPMRQRPGRLRGSETGGCPCPGEFSWGHGATSEPRRPWQFEVPGKAPGRYRGSVGGSKPKKPPGRDTVRDAAERPTHLASEIAPRRRLARLVTGPAADNQLLGTSNCSSTLPAPVSPVLPAKPASEPAQDRTQHRASSTHRAYLAPPLHPLCTPFAPPSHPSFSTTPPISIRNQ